MKLIFLHGMPAVGKLTVAREIATRTGFRLFHNHLTVDLVTSLFEFGSEPFVELREKIWLDAFSEAVRAKLPGLIFTFAYDWSVRRSFVENLMKIVDGSENQIYFVELTCTPDELEKRLTDPSRQQFGKLISLEQFRQLNQAGAFVDPGIPTERLVIDTTSLTPADTAEEVIRKLQLKPIAL
ncbi:MAG TPA: AAA family ATPase [Pyrinomonadaceae bacterium]|nr:AAA family ATPase [Pyrinomonadaceae bacterium]